MTKPKLDLSELRQRLDGDTGVQFHLDADYERAKAVGGRASTGSSLIVTAIKCYVVGYDREAQQLLRKAEEWISDGIRDDEHSMRYGANASKAQRHRDIALCHWLLNGEADRSNLAMFVKYQNQFYSSSELAKDRLEISLIAPTYINAAAYDDFLILFANAYGASPAKLARSEAGIAYEISQSCARHNGLGQEFLEEPRRFLTRKATQWMTDGHYDRAAEWAKICYWNYEADRSNPADIIRQLAG